MNVNGKHITAALLLAAAGVGFWAGDSPTPEVRPVEAVPSRAVPTKAVPVPQPLPSLQAAPGLEPIAKQPVVEAAPADAMPATLSPEQNPYHQMQESLGQEPPRSDPSSYANRALQIEGDANR